MNEWILRFETVIEHGKVIHYDCDASSDTTTLTYSAVATYDSANTETQTASEGQFEATLGELGEASIVVTVTDAVSKTNACSAQTVFIQGTDDDAIVTETKEDTNNVLIIQ